MATSAQKNPSRKLLARKADQGLPRGMPKPIPLSRQSSWTYYIGRFDRAITADAQRGGAQSGRWTVTRHIQSYKPEALKQGRQ
jgi:hypothetical protein